MLVWLAAAALSVTSLVISAPGWFAQVADGDPGISLLDDGQRVRLGEVLYATAPGAVLTSGDEVVAIDGHPIERDTCGQLRPARHQGPPGSVHTWSLRGADGDYDAELRYAHSPLADGLASLGVAQAHSLAIAPTIVGDGVQGVIFVGIALLAAVAGRRSAMALLMSAALLTYGVGELFSDGLHDCSTRTIHDACRAGTSLGLMMVCVWFPDGRVHAWWAGALAAVWTAVVFAVLYPVVLPWDGLSAGPGGTAVELALLVAGVATLAHRYRGATPVDKARMRWMVAAVGVAVAAILVREIGLVPEGIPGDLYADLVYPIAVCAIPVALVGGSTHRSLWELPRATREVSYALGAALTVLLGGLAMWTTATALGASIDLAAGLGLGASAAAAATMWILRDGFRRAFELLLFPRHAQAQDVLAAAKYTLQDARDLDELQAILRATMKSAWDAESDVWMTCEDGWTCPVPLGPPPPRELSTEPMVAFDEQRPEGTAGTLCVPVHLDGELLAVLCVGPRMDGSGFGSELVAMLVALEEELALAIQRLGRERPSSPIRQRLA